MTEERSILWARLSVRHTKKTCFFAILVPVATIVILYFTKLFVLTDPSENEYLVKKHPIPELYHARLQARDQYPYESSDVVAPLTKTSRSREISILLRNSGSKRGGSYRAAEYSENEPFNSLLTPEAIAFLKAAEDGITAADGYERFCYNNVDDNKDCEGNIRFCALPFSITSHPLLYGEYDDTGRLCGRKSGSESVSESKFAQFLESLVIDGAPNPAFSVFMANDFNATSQKTQLMRSFISMGDPIPDTVDSTEKDEKAKDYTDWAKKAIDDVEARNNEEFHVYALSQDRANSIFNPIIYRDLSFAGISILLVFIVVWAHTSSGFLACTTLCQIILSFPLTFFVYRLVFQVRYFAALQIMMIFLILGIGADDVFVFTDAWKQAAVILGKNVDLEQRMSWSYKRAVKAMFVTTFTTSVAFFSTAGSPIMPISTLGVWAGLLVLLQFVLVITIYPSALILWQRFWRIRKWWRCFRLPKATEPEGGNEEPSKAAGFFKRRKTAEGEFRRVERFFNGPWTKITFISRWPLFILGAILIGMSIWLATKLETPREEEKFLPDDNPVIKATDLVRFNFPSFNDNENIAVSVIWGLLGIDRSKTDKYDPEDFGEPVFDEQFSLRSAEAQKRILQACDYFADSDKGLLTNSTTIRGKVNCWPRDYLEWRKSQGKTDFETFPDDQSLVDDLLEFGEAEVNGGKPFRKYLTSQRIVFDKNFSKVLYTELRFISPVLQGAPYAVVWPNQETWHEAKDEFNAATSVEGVSRAVVSGGAGWSWPVTQKALVDNMFLGIVVVLSVSLVALALSTGNLIVAVLALTSIAGILTNVLALIYLYGWYLGITESIGVVIAIGFSFDYIAHVANAYVESPRTLERKERTRAALTELGISVLAGAISTVLAGSMLFFATIIFFVKFGIFVVTTVCLALLWGLVFFPVLLHLFGSEGDNGEIYTFLKKLLKRNNKPEGTQEPREIDESA